MEMRIPAHHLPDDAAGTCVGGRGDIVKHQGTAIHHARQPQLRVAPHRFVRMVAVDEEQLDRFGDTRRGLLGRHDQRIDDLGQAASGKVGEELVQGVGVGILTGETVRVDRVDAAAGEARARREPRGRSPLPRSDLDDRTAAGGCCRGLEEGAALRVAQPAVDIRRALARAFGFPLEIGRQDAPFPPACASARSTWASCRQT